MLQLLLNLRKKKDIVAPQCRLGKLSVSLKSQTPYENHKQNKKIHKAFGNIVDDIHNASSAQEAVRISYQLAKKGYAVLLSPACASFDLFENYEERGMKFKKAVRVSEINAFKLPLWTNKMKMSGEQFLLTGDAAHLIDPLAGHGIDKAVKSGMLAAQQVKRCFQENNFSSEFVKAYDRSVYDSYEKELNRNYKLMKLLFNYPWLIQVSLTIIKFNKSLFHKIFYSSSKKH